MTISIRRTPATPDRTVRQIKYKLLQLMDDAEAVVLAYMGFPAQHRTKIHSTDALDKRVCVCRGTEFSHHHRFCAVLVGGLFFVLGCSCQAATNLL
jgi:putative transposase